MQSYPEKRVRTDQAPNMLDPQRRTLAPINEDNINKLELQDEYKTLLKYKINLFKLDAIISTEENEEAIQEFKNMAEELTEAIKGQEDKIKEQQDSDIFAYSTDLIKEENIQRLGKCYFEKDNKWYHAIIVSIDFDEQEAEVQFIGYKDIVKLHAIFIRLLPIPGKCQNRARPLALPPPRQTESGREQ